MKCACGGQGHIKLDGEVFELIDDGEDYRLTGELWYGMTCDKCGGSVGGNSDTELHANWQATQKARKRRWAQKSTQLYLASKQTNDA